MPLPAQKTRKCEEQKIRPKKARFRIPPRSCAFVSGGEKDQKKLGCARGSAKLLIARLSRVVSQETFEKIINNLVRFRCWIVLWTCGQAHRICPGEKLVNFPHTI